MSAPNYDSSNYDNAAKKYSELQDKYTGEKGWALADSQGQDAAQRQSANAGANAAAAASRSARTAGMTRGQAAAMGANQAANAASNSYNSAYENARSQAIQNNGNTINAQAAKLSAEAQKDANYYNAESAKYNARMGLVGGVFKGIASALSDETKKTVYDSSSSKRCDELLKRLRGDK